MLTRAQLGRRAVLAGDAASELLFRAKNRSHGLAHANNLSATATVLDRALSLGVGFLQRVQRQNGAWVDFRLPPGASDEWMTAHVAFVLEDVAAMDTSTLRAADYLARSGSGRAGWGYNRRVLVDCDSTAQAVIVLHKHGIRPAGRVVDWLVSTQASSGGFPTYEHRPGTPAHGWNVEHPDVTLLVIESLRRLGVAIEAQHAAAEWLEASTHGSVTSYWWPSASYALWAQIRTSFAATDAAARAVELLDAPHAVPHSAMLAEAAARGGALSAERAKCMALPLLSEQLRDGSFPCSPCLRVTEPTVMTSYSAAPGRLYAGARRVFSTAHAVAALNELSKPVRATATAR